MAFFGSDITQNQRLFHVCMVAYLCAARVSMAPRLQNQLNARDTNITTKVLLKCCIGLPYYPPHDDNEFYLL